MSKEITEHTESAIAAVFGLSVADLRQLLPYLKEGEDYRKKARGGFVFTSAGRENLIACLDLAKGTVPAPVPLHTADLTIHSLCRNPRLVRAFDPEKKGGPEVRVIVSNNSACRRGMVLKACRPEPSESGLWRFPGHLRTLPTL